MEDVPEAAEPHRAGRRDWFGMIVSLAALATSGASIFIAVQNADSMERLVEANSWPYLQLDSSNVVDSVRTVQLSLLNTGVGPLRLESFVVRGDDGKAVRNVIELIQDSYDAQWSPARSAESGLITYTSMPGGRVLAPGDGIVVLGIPFDDANAQLWHAVDRARFSYRFEACYCSVFEECWQSTLGVGRPQPIARCPDQPDSWRG